MKTAEISKIKKPEMMVEGKELIPKITNEYVKLGDYPMIDENQLLAVNLCLQSYFNGNNGFLLADHTGFGKTMTELVVADYISKKTGKEVLIISENVQILTNNFANDEEHLKINNKLIKKGTYYDISANKLEKHYELIIFDEAHNLKNEESLKSIGATNISAKFKVFATATPMDTIKGCNYFIGEITGMSEFQIMDLLGLKVTIIDEVDANNRPTGKKIKRVVFKEGQNAESLRVNVIKIRNGLIEKGLFIRRVFGYWGTIEETLFDLSEEQMELQDSIESYWEEIEEESKTDSGYIPPKKLMMLRGQKSGELSRWTESIKVSICNKIVAEELADGRQVVVIAEGINDTNIKGLGYEVEGFIKSITKKFEEKKIDYSMGYSITGTRKANEINKFQANKLDVIIGTPKSISTGVDLDDQIGCCPRTLIMVTANYSGNIFQQILGRVSRRNTKTPSKIILLYSKSTSDFRRKKIVDEKLAVLKAIQEGKLATKEGDMLVKDVLDYEYQKANVPVGGFTSETGVAKTNPNITVERYKSATLVKGDTFPIKDELSRLGGKYNKFLKGYIFSGEKYDMLNNKYSQSEPAEQSEVQPEVLKNNDENRKKVLIKKTNDVSLYLGKLNENLSNSNSDSEKEDISLLLELVNEMPNI